MSAPVLQTSIPGWQVRRGKVRDIYDLGDRLLLVSSDRISAFDWVLPTGIPDKGRVLTQISSFWFGMLGEPNHMLSSTGGANAMRYLSKAPWLERASGRPGLSTLWI